ncbi:hypothetical protein [Leucobacter sp. GX24907]
MSNSGAEPFTLVSPDLDALIAEAPVSSEKLQIRRVFQGAGFRIIRLTLAAGQVMREHSTSSPLAVQVLAGTALMRVADQEVSMPTGALMTIEPSELHEVEAVTDAHLLLTLAV